MVQDILFLTKMSKYIKKKGLIELHYGWDDSKKNTIIMSMIFLVKTLIMD